MKIAQIAPLAQSVPPKLYGGTERVVSYLSDELVRAGHEVTLFASGDSQTRARLVPCAPRALRLDPRVKDPLPHLLLMIEQVRQRAQELDVLLAFLGRVAPEKGLDRAIGIARRAGVRLRIAAKIDLADERYYHQRIVPLLRHPLMEFVGGFERRRGKAPTLYPVACAPQAWAACAPFALLQACLGLEIDAASATVILRRPRLPQFLDWLSVRGLRIGESTLDLMFRRHDSSVAVNLVRREGDAEVDVLL